MTNLTPSPSLESLIASENASVTHAEFAAGVNQGTISCHFVGNSFSLLADSQKKAVAVFVILYAIVPPLLIPLWAYHEHRRSLLWCLAASPFGIFLASRAVAQGARATSGGFLPFMFAGLWIFEGLRSTETMASLCALWSWALFLIADSLQDHWATQRLVESTTAFEQTKESGKALIIRKPDA